MRIFVEMCVHFCSHARILYLPTYARVYVRIDGQVHEGESWADGLMGGVSEDRTSAHEKVRVHMRP